MSLKDARLSTLILCVDLVENNEIDRHKHNNFDRDIKELLFVDLISIDWNSKEILTSPYLQEQVKAWTNIAELTGSELKGLLNLVGTVSVKTNTDILNTLKEKGYYQTKLGLTNKTEQLLRYIRALIKVEQVEK